MNRNPFQIRLCTLHSLIFFSLFLSASCEKKAEAEISIHWEDDRAVGLTIPTDLLDNPDLAQFSIRLAQEGNNVSMLGELKKNGQGVLFTPLIPFTRGQTYEILYDGSVIGTVPVPELNGDQTHLAVLEIYPTQDTLPENQLKFFLKFSKPMREGESSSHVSLLNSKGDTLKGVFLDLQPELWNEDQTMLTLWLDPGRIKRDLIPNLEMGAPLVEKESYHLVISDRWRGKSGGKLAQAYTKDFVVTSRDSTSTTPASWTLGIPKEGRDNALNIDFGEALDYSLLQEVFKVWDSKSQQIPGRWEIGFEEKSVQFTPESAWKKDKYVIEIESRLEDLAGNNLNRLFETDLTNPSKTATASDFKRLEFEVRK